MSKEVYANPNALVSADWLAAHRADPGVRVVEVDVSPKSYDEGHIPGAVFWDIYKALKDPKYRLVDDVACASLLSTSGITPSTKVVFYGYGPALGYWLLKLYGHADASVLNLSKRQWQEDGRPWTTDRPEPMATHYPLPEPNGEIRAQQPMVAASIGDAECAILDVRSEAEFRGERFWPSGATENTGRAGHIPGALNVTLDAVVNADGSYAPVDVLRRTFPARLDDVRDLITYCTIGNRASVAWFVLSELLGRRGVSVYDGSWAEWGFMPATPIETETPKQR
ncbi:MAG TPA: sulfurtransferase [Candidatus Tumulicola sp.]|nr:sulfurtransferase [Candidatus Tumulicola sp.]